MGLPAASVNTSPPLQVMTHLWTLLLALLLLLLLLSAAERLDNPEENEVLKRTEGELTESQASGEGNTPV